MVQRETETGRQAQVSPLLLARGRLEPGAENSVWVIQKGGRDLSLFIHHVSLVHNKYQDS